MTATRYRLYDQKDLGLFVRLHDGSIRRVRFPGDKNEGRLIGIDDAGTIFACSGGNYKRCFAIKVRGGMQEILPTGPYNRIGDLQAFNNKGALVVSVTDNRNYFRQALLTPIK